MERFLELTLLWHTVVEVVILMFRPKNEHVIAESSTISSTE